MPKGTILFSSRAPIGYVAIAANEIATNRGFKSFAFPSDIFPDYAYYFLRNIRHIAEEMGTGTTFKEISGSSAKNITICSCTVCRTKKSSLKNSIRCWHR
ncbi:restriction endonuclease subunit S [Escherichia coli]